METLFKNDEQHLFLLDKLMVNQVTKISHLDIALQPIVDLITRQPIGYEALSRFPAFPQYTTTQIFSCAEKYGLDVDLESNSALKSSFCLSMIKNGFLSINVSPRTIQSSKFQAILSNLPLGRIVLEITERQDISDYRPIVSALEPFRKKGLQIAVDDLGAGYASMRHVIELEPEIIKIDKYFTQSTTDSIFNTAFFNSLSKFANESGCTLIAEGIETQQHCANLVGLGIDFGQGFFLAKPQRLLHLS